ncbi:tRNA (adenosine(37)-N6)-threonylcarbamoyltransferase complex dimerization subunit type 1 TsaB [Bartonella sp. TP]|uniref:tRNA (adenosine(37)-N6)-threonylcarbamoyltransferase complex dimerization subunit type 1 TsaB n=1 Tax=Bartonella sp. TP TaxID=3057550 RepID=UPI0025B0A520|nr:tRNA (adenosine(37)-N6)-threonylcarbamoyltransferase complex dimerization subunit type 1 TsaB [Bartonella sp. TP]MDN5248571.1 tRNA (adenosine(37)-N6)-threonylcarbamoyltransferase complex dimerization subunit type 1 TsaB [Alphaproteobacteria bacterium]WJW80387.1 tRNA (adenosine(37)-N6)-threonylcarbamoyltransferase complex dimerization subunit type 1 TsaB [Bartonella sp. TP]
MKILTIDTASDMCMCMIKETAGIQHSAIENIGRGHAERLILQIDELCKKANLSLSELDAVCVNTGPGSFTGIRIGVASARGLQLALQKPAIGVSYFTALGLYAHTLCEDKNIAVIFKAYSGHYNCMFWSPNENFFDITTSSTLSLEQLKTRVKNNYIIIGNGAQDLESPDKIVISNEDLLQTLDNIARQILSEATQINSNAITCPPKPLYMLPYQQHSER